MGRKHKHALRSHLAVLLTHLIKWKRQPEYPGKNSWKYTIITQRSDVGNLLRKRPGLKSTIDEAMINAWADATDMAARETKIEIDILAVPQTCPWSLDKILNKDFWPDKHEWETISDALAKGRYYKDRIKFH